jgi:hypothetical protein
VNVRRFTTIAGVEEKTVRTHAKHSRHLPMLH